MCAVVPATGQIQGPRSTSTHRSQPQGVLLTRDHRKSGNSISAAEAMLALLNCLDNQLMPKGTFFAIIELALFLAELHL